MNDRKYQGRKYREYTLWLKYCNVGWIRAFTVVDHGWPGQNPIEICKEWYEKHYTNPRWDKSKMIILPRGKEPSVLAEQYEQIWLKQMG